MKPNQTKPNHLLFFTGLELYFSAMALGSISSTIIKKDTKYFKHSPELSYSMCIYSELLPLLSTSGNHPSVFCLQLAFSRRSSKGNHITFCFLWRNIFDSCRLLHVSVFLSCLLLRSSPLYRFASSVCVSMYLC